ncbi:MAG: BlaI/MecI/CopY family transcriptional regulator [bacterium]|nr:BlaI/MecI/CopY family transcriptional regulator [bacterium]
MAINSIKILSDSESEIMEIVWCNGQTCVRDVLKELKKKKKIAYTTVMTVMSRLYEKGVLVRKMNKSGAFVYEPVNDKKTFIEKKSEKIIKGFLKEYGDVAVAQFLDVIETSSAPKSEEWKNKLKKLIK